MSEITLTPESYRTSQISPLVLSESQRVQVSFEGRQVDNLHDLRKNIKGKLVIKKRIKRLLLFLIPKNSARKISVPRNTLKLRLTQKKPTILQKGFLLTIVCLAEKQRIPFPK